MVISPDYLPACRLCPPCRLIDSFLKAKIGDGEGISVPGNVGDGIEILCEPSNRGEDGEYGIAPIDPSVDGVGARGIKIVMRQVNDARRPVPNPFLKARSLFLLFWSAKGPSHAYYLCSFG